MLNPDSVLEDETQNIFCDFEIKLIPNFAQ